MRCENAIESFFVNVLAQAGKYADGALPPMMRLVRASMGVLLITESYKRLGTFTSGRLHQATGKTWWMSMFSSWMVAKAKGAALRQSAAPLFICSA